MDPLAWLLIIPVIFLILLSALFSSSETAFACLNKYFFIVKADKGDKKAKQIVTLYEKFDSTLITALIGYNVCSVIISTISTVVFLNVLLGKLDSQIISLLSSIFVAIIAYIFCDSVPKVIAKNNPAKTAERNIGLLVFFLYAFYPLTKFFLFITSLFKKIFKTNPPPELTEEDFTNVVESIEEKGGLKENESDIIQASLDFSETSVKEVLTPIDKMFMIDYEKLSNGYVLSLLNESSFSRIPVYYKNKDNIVGILIVKQYLNNLLSDSNHKAKNSLQKPYFVSPKIMMDDLLDGFKEKHTQIAIVKYQRKVLGMVTSEDVLEELVGKINEKTGSENGGKK